MGSTTGCHGLSETVEMTLLAFWENFLVGSSVIDRCPREIWSSLSKYQWDNDACHKRPLICFRQWIESIVNGQRAVKRNRRSTQDIPEMEYSMITSNQNKNYMVYTTCQVIYVIEDTTQDHQGWQSARTSVQATCIPVPIPFYTSILSVKKILPHISTRV
jgi:hypothetical protein